MELKNPNFSYTGTLHEFPAQVVIETSADLGDLDTHDVLRILDHVNTIIRLNNFESMLPELMDYMILIAGASTATFYLVDHNSEELVFTKVRNEAASHLEGLRIKKDQGVVGAAVSERQPIIVEDLANDPRWLYSSSNVESQLYNALTIPLIVANEVEGAIQLFNYHRPVVKLLQVIGNFLMTEVDRYIKLEATQQQNKRLKTLIEVIGHISGTLDRDQLMQLVTEHTSQLVGAERSSIFIVDPETDEVAAHVSYKTPPPNTNQNSKPQPTFVKWIPDRNSTVQPPGGSHSRVSEAKTQWRTGFMTRSALTIPLQAGPITLNQNQLSGEQILGGLMAVNQNQVAFNDEDAQLLEILANQTSTILQVTDLFEDANQLLVDVIKALAATIDAKDPYTRGHSLRVSTYAVAIATELGFSLAEINDIRIGSLLHDVGKIGVPDKILMKPDKLTPAEYHHVKEHPLVGFNIMSEVQMLKPVLPAIAEHHERLDGSGYPHGLKVTQISPMGRIVAVADVYDALTTDRPYRKALSIESATLYLKNNVDTYFDKKYVNAFIPFIKKELL
jgi:putative nucleotidyltransferase with HDIG domain